MHRVSDAARKLHDEMMARELKRLSAEEATTAGRQDDTGKACCHPSQQERPQADLVWSWQPPALDEGWDERAEAETRRLSRSSI